ncbi:iron chaperone [Microbacterium gorillae]|uniref:iron chaperone n=1 Tax=Microbacterium gorillae TaxID=1231063 RepID=UPI003D95951C
MSDTTEGRMSATERAAVKARSAELRAEKKRAAAEDKAAAELQDVLDAIAKLPDDERAVAERVHAVVLDAAPQLQARTWYGMPAYALDGKVICWFKNASKFRDHYNSLGFENAATLDEGTMWPIVYAITDISAADEERIAALVTRAVGS